MSVDSLHLKCNTPNGRLSFVKLDSKGSELKALSGMMDTVVRCRPYLLYETGSHDLAMYNLLQPLGYIFYHHAGLYYNPNNFYNNPQNDMDWSSSMVLASPKELHIGAIEECGISKPQWYSFLSLLPPFVYPIIPPLPLLPLLNTAGRDNFISQ